MVVKLVASKNAWAMETKVAVGTANVSVPLTSELVGAFNRLPGIESVVTDVIEVMEHSS